MFTELGSSTEADTYGQFDNDRKMFIDQGWLLGETEIQLRYYKDPIHMFKVIRLIIIMNFILNQSKGKTQWDPLHKTMFYRQ